MHLFSISPLLLVTSVLQSLIVLVVARPVYYIVDERATSNFQTFTGALGAPALPVTSSGDSQRPFEVEGDTFVNLGAALQRSCDVQFNQCADSANASGNKGDLTVQTCQEQQTQCIAVASSASANTGASSAASGSDSSATSTSTSGSSSTCT